MSKLILLSNFFAFLFFFEKCQRKKAQNGKLIMTNKIQVQKNKHHSGIFFVANNFFKSINFHKLCPKIFSFLFSWLPRQEYKTGLYFFCSLVVFSKKNKKAKKIDNKISFDTIQFHFSFCSFLHFFVCCCSVSPFFFCSVWILKASFFWEKKNAFW